MKRCLAITFRSHCSKSWSRYRTSDALQGTPCSQKDGVYTVSGLATILGFIRTLTQNLGSLVMTCGVRSVWSSTRACITKVGPATKRLNSSSTMRRGNGSISLMRLTVTFRGRDRRLPIKWGNYRFLLCERKRPKRLALISIYDAFTTAC